jgi:hypothetical protein
MKIDYLYKFESSHYGNSTKEKGVLVVTGFSTGKKLVYVSTVCPNKKMEWIVPINSIVWDFTEIGHKNDYPEYFI